MCVVAIVASLVTISCPNLVSPIEAARVLADATGLSNRTNVYPIPDRPRPVFVSTTLSSVTKPMEPRRLDGTPLSQPPQVYGIPYPWTPLTWAILHAGTTGQRERD